MATCKYPLSLTQPPLGLFSVDGCTTKLQVFRLLARQCEKFLGKTSHPVSFVCHEHNLGVINRERRTTIVTWVFRVRHDGWLSIIRLSQVERIFVTLYGPVGSMMNHANLPLTVRKEVSTEVAATATNIDTFLVTNNKPVASYNAFHEKEAPFVCHLRTFGENWSCFEPCKKGH
jgi:hypothetical protein